LSDLNLGPSDDEDDDNHEPPQIIHEGISQFASLLSPEAPSPSKIPDQQPLFRPTTFRCDCGGHAGSSDHQTRRSTDLTATVNYSRQKEEKSEAETETTVPHWPLLNYHKTHHFKDFRAEKEPMG
jgi:hypothetical protein